MYDPMWKQQNGVRQLESERKATDMDGCEWKFTACIITYKNGDNVMDNHACVFGREERFMGRLTARARDANDILLDTFREAVVTEAEGLTGGRELISTVDHSGNLNFGGLTMIS